MGVTHSLHSKKKFNNMKRDFINVETGGGKRASNKIKSISISASEYVDVFFDQYKDFISPILAHKKNLANSNLKVSDSDTGNYRFFKWNKIDLNDQETIPTRRNSHTMVSIGSKIYLYGGFDGNKYLNDVYSFDCVERKWELLKTTGTQPRGRAFHSSWCYNKKIYIYAGFNGKNILDDLYCLDCESLIWEMVNVSGTIPHPRFEHAAYLVDNEIYLFGGANEISWLSDVHILNLDTLVWRYINIYGDAPPKRCAHSLVGNGSHFLFLFGGYNGSNRLNDLYILDCTRKRWIQISPQNNKLVGRAAHTAHVNNNLLLLIGGFDGQNKLMDITCFNSDTMEWNHSFIVGSPPPGRSYHSSVLIDNNIYIFGGYGESNQLAPDIFELEPITPSLTDLCIVKILKNQNIYGTNLDKYPEGLLDLIKNRKIIKNIYI